MTERQADSTGASDPALMSTSSQHRPSRRWFTYALLLLALAAFVVRGVLLVQNTRRDHDGWIVAAAVTASLVLVAVLVWLMNRAWSRRAEKVRREHPGAWVRPMSWGRSLTLLYLDATDVKLLGLRGRVRRTYYRADLVAADTGPIRFPAATRTGLRLHFRNGDELDLLTTRRGGLASSGPDARSACNYLGFDQSTTDPSAPST